MYSPEALDDVAKALLAFADLVLGAPPLGDVARDHVIAALLPGESVEGDELDGDVRSRGSPFSAPLVLDGVPR
jgi:hypothetical protein